MRVEAGAYRDKVSDEEAKDKVAVEFDGEAGSGKEGRDRNDTLQKKI